MKLCPADKILLEEIHRFALSKKIQLYIVGGYLRDIILKRQRASPDIDFCLLNNSIRFAKQLALYLKAGFVVLDKEHGLSRLVKKVKDKVYTLDFADFRAPTLDGDLSGRDFTINCLAVNLKDVISNENFSAFVIDPGRARYDLRKKIIRVVNSRSFDDDPLRILRAFSLSCIFGFKIEKKTLKLIKAKKNKLAGISYERIRDELFKILSSTCAFEYLRDMDKLGILKIIIPEIEIMRGVNQGPYHHLDVFKHSLETVRQLEIVIQEYKNNSDVCDYLNEFISGPRQRYSLVKLGAFLHDIGKPGARRKKGRRTIFHGHERIGSDITKKIAKRLKLSNEELDVLRRMVFWHLRPGYMGDAKILSARAKFRYFRDSGKEAASTLLLSLADQRSTLGPLTSRQSRIRHEKVVSGLIKEYFRKQKENKIPRLLNGNDLIAKLRLKPSPLIGKILASLEELQATGRVKTKEQAYSAAKKIIKTEGKK